MQEHLRDLVQRALAVLEGLGWERVQLLVDHSRFFVSAHRAVGSPSPSALDLGDGPAALRLVDGWPAVTQLVPDRCRLESDPSSCPCKGGLERAVLTGLEGNHGRLQLTTSLGMLVLFLDDLVEEEELRKVDCHTLVEHPGLGRLPLLCRVQIQCPAEVAGALTSAATGP